MYCLERLGGRGRGARSLAAAQASGEPGGKAQALVPRDEARELAAARLADEILVALARERDVRMGAVVGHVYRTAETRPIFPGYSRSKPSWASSSVSTTTPLEEASSVETA